MIKLLADGLDYVAIAYSIKTRSTGNLIPQILVFQISQLSVSISARKVL